MNYLLTALLAVACCNLAIATVWLGRALLVKTPKPSAKFDPASYNLGIRDAGEIVRDVRIEAGINVAENWLLEEIFSRLRKCRK